MSWWFSFNSNPGDSIVKLTIQYFFDIGEAQWPGILILFWHSKNETKLFKIYFSPRLQLQYNSFSCCTYKQHVRTKINWFWQWHKNSQKMSDIWLQYLHHWKVWQLLQDSSHLRSNKIWQHGIIISDQFCKIFCDKIFKKFPSYLIF